MLIDEGILSKFYPILAQRPDLLINFKPLIGKILKAVRLWSGKDTEVQNVGGWSVEDCSGDNGLGVHSYS